jgi:RNA-directed DNA polymerase
MVPLILQEMQNRQMELVKTAENHGVKSEIVQRKQEILARSLLFRIAAIALLMFNKGSKTPGIDGQILTKDTNIQDLTLLVDYLFNSLKSGYKANPVRRIMIPTIKDRALQSLINLVLLPLVEMKSDTHSYGFRPYRSTKNAVAILRANLKSKNENKWILDADIKGFFDNINHE